MEVFALNPGIGCFLLVATLKKLRQGYRNATLSGFDSVTGARSFPGLPKAQPRAEISERFQRKTQTAPVPENVMCHRLSFISVTVLVLLFSFPARSQEPAAVRKVDESAAAALRKKAIDLLESVAGQIASLRSAENRARIGSNVAELLWNHDEKRARNLFAAVLEDINSGFNDTDPDYASHNHTLRVFGKLRSDTVGRIAKHDPESALEFLRATRPPSDMQLPYEMRFSEKSLELQLAGQIAAKNPQLALNLGRQSLSEGFSPDLLSVLSQLQRKDRDASLTFYKEIVDKLKAAKVASQDTAATEAALNLALNLARGFPPPEAEEIVYRDLIGVVLASALANGCVDATEDNAPQICFEIGSVFSRIERYHPQEAARLKRLAVDAHGSDGPSLEIWSRIRDVIEKGTVDEILALAPKYPELHEQIYWGAMMKAEASGDVARARKIATDFPNEEERRSILARIDHNQARGSMDAAKLAAIQQELSNLRSNEDRLRLLFSVVHHMRGDDKKATIGLLNQAAVIIDSMRPGKSKLEGRIGLATLYCSLKSDRGFAIMEPAMPRLNELVTAAAVLDRFENNYLRDGEWNMTGEGALGGLLTQLAQNAGCFAVLDFDRSVTLAGQFERPELRLMAQLSLAQGVLAKPKPVTMSLGLSIID